MTISLFDLLVLMGCLQGFILAALLWFQPKGNRLSNRLLGTLVGLLGLMSLAVGLPHTNRWMTLARDLLPFFMAMPVGPLIYFYTRSVLDPSFRLNSRDRRHFYAVGLDWAAPLMGWVFIGGLLLGFFREAQGPAWGDVMDEYNTYIDIPRWLSLATYLYFTRQLLRKTRPDTPDGNAGQIRDRQWLGQLVGAFLVFQVIWLLHLVPYSIPSLRWKLLDQVGWYPVYIPIAVLIYWLGLKGYLHARNVPREAEGRKAATTSLPAETVEKAVLALTGAMQTDKLYLDPELTVEKVARHLGLPAKTVSFVVNQHLQLSFNAWVNAYRIEAVKRKLANQEHKHLTLTGIAFECGFNSQATFGRAFKQMIGVGPGEYVKRAGKTVLKSGSE
jgi:AraC-like DNA-binding protein